MLRHEGLEAWPFGRGLKRETYTVAMDEKRKITGDKPAIKYRIDGVENGDVEQRSAVVRQRTGRVFVVNVWTCP